MTIGTGLTIASTGLAALERQFSVISQNVANANTPGYATETSSLTALGAAGFGMGVASGPATRSIDKAAQSAMVASGAASSYQGTIAQSLSGLDPQFGTPGQGNDLPSLLGNLQSAFSTLLGNPSDAVQQQAVVSAAGTLAGRINAIGQAIGAARQNAQNSIATDVKSLNAALAQIGKLNAQIVSLKQQGLSTADLANQRDSFVQQVANLTGAKSASKPDGAVALYASSGLALPTNGTATFSISAATVTTASYYPGGGLPGIKLGGTDVTASLSGGSIGAQLMLRDQKLPQLQAGLDSFSQALASRFQAQGLTLFSTSSGSVPSAASATGFSLSITVNPSVAAKPSLVRDGTAAVAGSATGASSFTPNPGSGPAGFTALIQRVLAFSLGANVQNGVSQPSAATSNLGPAGGITLDYAGSGTLSDVATAFVGTASATSAAAQTASSNAKALQAALTGKFSATSSVSVDKQMGTLVALQNAYAANAKVVSIAQSMWQTTEAMVQ